MKYEIKINETSVYKSSTFKSPPIEDTYFCRIKLEEPIDVPAESSLEIIVWIALSMTDFTYVNTWSGNNGEQFNEIDNENKGLFKIESSNDNQNGTGVYSGHFPELFYYLC